MIKIFKSISISIGVVFTAAACQTTPEPEKSYVVDGLEAVTLTKDEHIAYQYCLAQSQAVAMVWDAIEQACLEGAIADRTD